MEWHEIFAEAYVFDPDVLRDFYSRVSEKIRIGLTMHCPEQGQAS